MSRADSETQGTTGCLKTDPASTSLGSETLSVSSSGQWYYLGRTHASITTTSRRPKTGQETRDIASCESQFGREVWKKGYILDVGASAWPAWVLPLPHSCPSDTTFRS